MTGSGDGLSPANARSRALRTTLKLESRGTTYLALCIACILAGCSSSERQTRLNSTLAQKVSPKLGVSASPYSQAMRRQSNARASSQIGALPKGGGYRKVGSPYKIGGRWYTPKEDPTYDRVGIASWYGSDFHGRLTANGETYDMNALTAAHKTLPLPSYAYVTNHSNGRTVLVQINDRGPYAGNRIIDLSRATARALDIERSGVGKVRVQFAGPAPLDGNDYHERKFLAAQNWAQPHRVALSRAYRQQRSSHTHRQSPRTTATLPRVESGNVWDPHRYRQGLGR